MSFYDPYFQDEYENSEEYFWELSFDDDELDDDGQFDDDDLFDLDIEDCEQCGKPLWMCVCPDPQGDVSQEFLNWIPDGYHG